MSKYEEVNSDRPRDTIVSFDQSNKFKSNHKSSLISRSGPDVTINDLQEELSRKKKLNLKDKEVHVVPGAANVNSVYLNKQAISYFNCTQENDSMPSWLRKLDFDNQNQYFDR